MIHECFTESLESLQFGKHTVQWGPKETTFEDIWERNFVMSTQFELNWEIKMKLFIFGFTFDFLVIQKAFCVEFDLLYN